MKKQDEPKKRSISRKIWNVILYFNTFHNFALIIILSVLLFVPAITQKGESYVEKVMVQMRVLKNNVKSSVYKYGLEENWDKTRNSFYTPNSSDTLLVKEFLYNTDSVKYKQYKPN